MVSPIKAAATGLLLFLALGAAGAQAAVPGRDPLEPHDFRSQGYECRTCHEAVGLRSRGRMLKPVGEICGACHRLPEQSHPVNVRPSMTTPADLPLDERGRMTCATCHDPHRPYLNPLTGARTKYLRRDGPNRLLCGACHKR